MDEVPDGPSDASLVADVLHGDIDRFEVLVRRYEPDLMRLAMARLNARELAEEAVQETLVAAFRYLNSYDNALSFRAWLVAILVNECRAQYGRLQTEKERTERTNQWEYLAERNGQRPEQRIEQLERYQSLCLLLDELSEDQAQAIWLRFFDGMKYKELASSEGCSLATAKNRVRLGLQKLGELLSRLEE